MAEAVPSTIPGISPRKTRAKEAMDLTKKEGVERLPSCEKLLDMLKEQDQAKGLIQKQPQEGSWILIRLKKEHSDLINTENSIKELWHQAKVVSKSKSKNKEYWILIEDNKTGSQLEGLVSLEDGTAWENLYPIRTIYRKKEIYKRTYDIEDELNDSKKYIIPTLNDKTEPGEQEPLERNEWTVALENEYPEFRRNKYAIITTEDLCNKDKETQGDKENWQDKDDWHPGFATRREIPRSPIQAKTYRNQETESNASSTKSYHIFSEDQTTESKTMAQYLIHTHPEVGGKFGHFIEGLPKAIRDMAKAERELYIGACRFQKEIRDKNRWPEIRKYLNKVNELEVKYWQAANICQVILDSDEEEGNLDTILKLDSINFAANHRNLTLKIGEDRQKLEAYLKDSDQYSILSTENKAKIYNQTIQEEDWEEQSENSNMSVAKWSDAHFGESNEDITEENHAMRNFKTPSLNKIDTLPVTPYLALTISENYDHKLLSNFESGTLIKVVELSSADFLDFGKIACVVTDSTRGLVPTYAIQRMKNAGEQPIPKVAADNNTILELQQKLKRQSQQIDHLKGEAIINSRKNSALKSTVTESIDLVKNQNARTNHFNNQTKAERTILQRFDIKHKEKTVSFQDLAEGEQSVKKTLVMQKTNIKLGSLRREIARCRLKLTRLEEDSNRAEQPIPLYDLTREAEHIEHKAEKFDTDLSNLHADCVSTMSTIGHCDKDFLDLLGETQDQIDNILDQSSNLRKRCRDTAKPIQNSALFKLVTLPDLHTTIHQPPGLFSWIKTVKAQMDNNPIEPNLWLEKLKHCASKTEKNMLATWQNTNLPKTPSEFIERLVQDYGQPLYYENKLREAIVNAGRMRDISSKNASFSHEQGGKYLTIMGNINLMKQYYEEKYSKDTAKLQATKNKGVFTVNFTSNMIQQFPQLTENKLIDELADWEPEKQLERMEQEINNRFKLCTRYLKDMNLTSSVPVLMSTEQNEQSANNTKPETHSVEKATLTRKQIQDDVRDIIKSCMATANTPSTSQSHNNSKPPPQQGYEPKRYANTPTPIEDPNKANRYICDIYHRLLTNQSIDPQCGISEHGSLKPSTDPSMATEFLTGNQEPNRKRGLIACQLHKHGCKICIALINTSSDKTCFPHLFIDNISHPYPTRSSIMCPNLIRVETPAKRRELMNKIDNMCKLCITTYPPGTQCDCQSRRYPKRHLVCNTCKANYTLGDCQECENKVQICRQKYNKTFQAACTPEEKNLNLSSTDQRIIAAYCNVISSKKQNISNKQATKLEHQVPLTSTAIVRASGGFTNMKELKKH